jgi:hypothetical protein
VQNVSRRITYSLYRQHDQFQVMQKPQQQQQQQQDDQMERQNQDFNQVFTLLLNVQDAKMPY